MKDEREVLYLGCFSYKADMLPTECVGGRGDGRYPYKFRYLVEE